MVTIMLLLFKQRENIDEIHLGGFKTVVLALTFMKFCLDVETANRIIAIPS